jgi:TonB-linked SusC/RagA family outer membrane protein
VSSPICKDRIFSVSKGGGRLLHGKLIFFFKLNLIEVFMKNFMKQWLRFLGILAGIFLVFLDASAQDQSTVMGKITDEGGDGLPGVTIVVQGTTNGTVTDYDGNYSISVAQDATLEISFVGFTTQIIQVNGQSAININMTTDYEELEQVLVVGYGTVKKSHSIGAVASVKGETLSRIPTATADQALIGQISGVNIKTGNGGSGQPAEIQVRGLASISASNSPLIVVDGYPIQGDLSSINMQDVESINVLKDAASAAIYGSRAGSGVILITTKQGKVGEVQFEYSYYGGIKTAMLGNLDKNIGLGSGLNKIPTMKQWRTFVTSKGITDTPELDLAESFGVDTDWYDEVFRTGSIQTHQLSARGGTENVKYFFSGNYVKDKGVVLTNAYSKYSFRANIDVKANEWLDFGLNLSPTYSERRDIQRENHQLFRTGPWVPVYHNSATAAITGKDLGSFAHENDFDIGRNSDYTGIKLRRQSDYNPIALLEGENLTHGRIEGFANTYLNFKLAEGLTFKTSFGGYINQVESQYWRASTTNRSGNTEAYFNTAKIIDWLNENVLTYTKDIKNHSITAVAGISTQKTQVINSEVSASDFVIDYIETVNGGVLSGGTSYRSTSALNSVFARMDYALSNKYLLSLSSRWDGSSRFGSNNQVGFFPSASIGWRVSEETFLSSSELIDNLKLRVSYGTTGNNNIGDYSHIGLLGVHSYISGDGVMTGYASDNISNTDLGWERTIETNAGIDLGIFDGRVQLVFDYFSTSTDDLLLEVPLSSVTGYEYYLANQGKVANNGFDLQLTTVNTTGKFKWSTNFNISHFKNELVDFGGTESLISIPDSKRPNEFLTEVGSPLVQFYGYEMESEVPWEAHQTSWPVGVNTDWVFAKDLNGDGEITEDDKTVLGSPYPDFTWGLTNNFSYGNFNLNVVLQGSHGAEIFSIDSYYENSQYELESPSDWDLTDDEIDRLVIRSNSSFNVQDASFISIRSVTLGYDLPAEKIEKIGLSGVNLYVTANNLLYRTAKNYSGFNPESDTSAQSLSEPWDSSPLIAGFQRGAHPLQKAFSIGLSVKF